MREKKTVQSRLHPRLRVVRNCDGYVAAFKSELTGTIATLPGGPADEGIAAAAPDFAELRQATEQLKPEARPRKRAPLKARTKLGQGPSASQSYVNVFIELQRNKSPAQGLVDEAGAERVEKLIQDGIIHALRQKTDIGAAMIARRSFISATVPVDLLPLLENDPAVAFVHPAEPLRLAEPIRAEASAPTARFVDRADLHGHGENVLVGIIDVGGFDFADPDFAAEDGGTRFLSIWDQAQGGMRPPPSKRGASAAFNYGSEITKAYMDAAIHASSTKRLPATRLEPQSQMSPGSHGTHVASIAAGNKGVASKAGLIGVLISVPGENDDFSRRRATFTDSSRIIHAIEYLIDFADNLGKPISINISLGTNGGSHDGASGVSRWIDALLATPGRSICIAAGNAGQESSEGDDMGFVTGRIHSTGRIAARGLDLDLEWTVIGDGIEDMSENELEIWYSAQDRLTVQVRPPGPNAAWIEVAPKQFVENKRLASGTTVSIYSELYHPTSGGNYIAIYLSPNYDPVTYRGVEAGVWTVRLRGDEIRDGRFNCWIERDDPGIFRAAPGRKLYRFPSFFSVKSNVDSHSVNSLGCGNRVTCVANLDQRRQRINISSSQGPTRDGRCKPDIAAPGSNIGAANGFAPRTDPWIDMTGTSMASPYVTGAIALMFAANPKLTAAQCAGVLQRTARPLPGHTYDWRNDAGFGVIDAAEAVAEGAAFDARTEIK